MSGNLERLLADVRSLYLAPAEGTAAGDGAEPIPYSGLVDPPPVEREDEKAIAAVMALLRDVAGAAAKTSALPPPPPNAVYGVLSGSELTMRWECLAGRSGELLGLLHGFTYLATIFYMEREPALRRSLEVRALVEAAGHKAR